MHSVVAAKKYMYVPPQTKKKHHEDHNQVNKISLK